MKLDETHVEDDVSGAVLGRREFLGAGSSLAVGAAGVGLTAASYARVQGANDRVGVGFIGYGLIGRRHVLDFRQQPDVNLLGLAETHSGRLEEGLGLLGRQAKGYGDFRELLDNREVDAVVVSTPDHWHALQTMMACAAGKDVYVEKPLTLFVREGRWMIDVARQHHSVVQVGTQQRSGKHYQRARDLIQKGHIGKVVSVRAQAYRNILPGFGSPPDGEPPRELNYDLWQGPAPRRPYNPHRAIYHFRWFWDYSGGQLTNLGQHSLDVVDWILGPLQPRSILSTGGRFALQDNGETPDVQDALFQFEGWTAAWSHRECARGEPARFGLVFVGTQGSLGISRNAFSVIPDPEVAPESEVPSLGTGHPRGGPTPPKDSAKANTNAYRTEPLDDRSGDSMAQFQDHVRNFLDCVKSRKTPASDLESGHRVASLCHLANLSLRLGRSFRWDAQREQILDDPEANAWLSRPYRAPWNRELHALGVEG